MASPIVNMQARLHVLLFVVGYYHQRGYGPSFFEIGEGCDGMSIVTAMTHVHALIKARWLRCEYDRRGYIMRRSLHPTVALAAMDPLDAPGGLLAGLR